jgi:hypothetical protein
MVIQKLYQEYCTVGELTEIIYRTANQATTHLYTAKSQAS